MTTTHDLAELGDRPLLERAKQLAIEERHATVALLRALAEIDSRRLYLGEGCSSMFTYYTEVLHLSEGGAYSRIEAWRAARRRPVIFELVESSALTLTTVRLLAPHLTDENHRAILEYARHKSRREVEELVARSSRSLMRPPSCGACLRRRRMHRHRRRWDPCWRQPADDAAAIAADANAVPAAKTPPARVTPLAPDRYRLQVTLAGTTHEKFRRAQVLLRHAVPSGNAAEILDRAETSLWISRTLARSMPRGASPGC